MPPPRVPLSSPQALPLDAALEAAHVRHFDEARETGPAAAAAPRSKSKRLGSAGAAEVLWYECADVFRPTGEGGGGAGGRRGGTVQDEYRCDMGGCGSAIAFACAGHAQCALPGATRPPCRALPSAAALPPQARRSATGGTRAQGSPPTRSPTSPTSSWRPARRRTTSPAGGRRWGREGCKVRRGYWGGMKRQG